jgi:hypothetical protein
MMIQLLVEEEKNTPALKLLTQFYSKILITGVFAEDKKENKIVRNEFLDSFKLKKKNMIKKKNNLKKFNQLF